MRLFVSTKPEEWVVIHARGRGGPLRRTGEAIRSSGTPGGVLGPEYAPRVSHSATWMMIRRQRPSGGDIGEPVVVEPHQRGADENAPDRHDHQGDAPIQAGRYGSSGQQRQQDGQDVAHRSRRWCDREGKEPRPKPASGRSRPGASRPIRIFPGTTVTSSRWRRPRRLTSGRRLRRRHLRRPR